MHVTAYFSLPTMLLRSIHLENYALAPIGQSVAQMPRASAVEKSMGIIRGIIQLPRCLKNPPQPEW